MFSKRMFAGMRRAGFGTNVSKNKLSQIVFDVLLQLPEGTANLKENVVGRLGLLGQMSATRDINAAWDMAKKRAAREYPGKFVLDGRKGLYWASVAPRLLDKHISAKNIKKLNDLADGAGCSVDQMVEKLVKEYRIENKNEPARAKTRGRS